MLHGGGMNGKVWRKPYEEGMFGDVSKTKFVFPTATINNRDGEGYNWYDSYKEPNCGLNDDCGYDLRTISYSGDEVAALIDYERKLRRWKDGSNIYLAGFSQGGQMATYVSLVKLDYALGGVAVLCGYPLPPLTNMPDQRVS